MTVGLRRTGVGLVLLYVAVAVATHALSPKPFRPLFDGFAPPEPYRWVVPPPESARDNLPPASAELDIALGPEGAAVTNATTSDSQAVAGLELGSVPPNPPDTGVKLQLTPLDPGTLGPLPAGLEALSNAYRVTLTYLPSQTAVTRLAKNGTVALTATAPNGALLYSADGTQWAELPSRPFGNTNGRFTTLQATGYYVVAGSHVPASKGPTESSPSGPNTLLLMIVGVLPMVGAILVLRPAAGRQAPGPRRKDP